MFFPAVLWICGTALADAPQFTVSTAGYVFNVHLQNWTCDPPPLSEISPPTTNCYSPYVSSYTFAHHGHITQNPNTSEYVWMMDGGARDGGFEPRVGDTLTTFQAQGPQGGTHKLRKTTSVEPAAYANYHWELFSTLYDPSRGKYYAFASVTDSGNLGAVKDNILFLGESASGVDNFTWTKVYQAKRPNGDGSGALFLFNNDRYILDPGNPNRWIGFLGWGGAGNDGGTAPSYIDIANKRFGVLFENDGWCEFPFGQVFDSFNAGATCTTGGTALPDLPYEIPFYDFPSWGKLTKALSLINGKAIVLWPEGTGQACADNDDTCIQGRAPCPPGQDLNLYKTRRNDPEYNAGTRWLVRELSLSTWNTSLRAHQWTGAAKVILDGTQTGQFKINPSDIPVGGYDAALKQYANGTIYLYLTIKHSLCLPATTDPLKAYNRPPGHSGSSMMWLRLTAAP